MRRRRLLSALAALTLALAGLPAPVRAATLPASFAETLVTSGLDRPTAMDFAPDGRLFVAEQDGALRVIKNGALLPAPFVDITVDGSGERGLLGVAFDPNFAANGYVYVYYTATTPAVHNRVSRFTANGDVAVPGSEVVVVDLENLTSATNHNGGAIHFGPDGKLYAGVGENANGANAQTLANRLGKLLRLNPDGSIPTDNPFYGAAAGANRAIWALGLRNPFTFTFQPGSGRMFINDVGAVSWEEINDGVAGANYGWPETEGYTADPRFRSPLYAYPHSGGDSGCAITGGAFYTPPVAQFPSDYAGDYFFGDLCGGWIRRYDPATNGVAGFATGVTSGLVDIKVAPDGSLYYLARGGGGVVYRVRYAGDGASPAGAAAWYFAEGFTGAGFDEYLTILNANATPAAVTIAYYLADGTTAVKALTVAPTSRATVAVYGETHGVGRGKEVSAVVTTTHPRGVVVERPMYFTYGGTITGGHTVLGATAPATAWYFAEGFTGAGFDEYLTILNPNPAPAPVTLTYYPRSGDPVVKNLTVGAHSRDTVAVHDSDRGVGRGQEVAALVTTSLAGGIVVERPMYFTYGPGWTGGHVALGATAPRAAWHFAEGFTGAGFDEYLTIMNPNSGPVTVTITYALRDGTTQTRQVQVGARRRFTVAVYDAALGVGRGQEVAATVTSSGGGIVVERPMYFTYAGGVDGGHDAVGAAAPRPVWYLAEGFTGASFDEYLTIFNPNATTAGVHLTYYLANGTTVERGLAIRATSRATVSVHDPAQGVGRGQAVAARVITTHPGGIVVERPMYFTYGSGITGGHDAMGFAP